MGTIRKGSASLRRVVAVCALLATIGPGVALAHSGRTNAEGCHKDTATNSEHCHNAGTAPSAPTEGRQAVAEGGMATVRWQGNDTPVAEPVEVNTNSVLVQTPLLQEGVASLSGEETPSVAVRAAPMVARAPLEPLGRELEDGLRDLINTRMGTGTCQGVEAYVLVPASAGFRVRCVNEGVRYEVASAPRAADIQACRSGLSADSACWP